MLLVATSLAVSATQRRVVSVVFAAVSPVLGYNWWLFRRDVKPHDRVAFCYLQLACEAAALAGMAAGALKHRVTASHAQAREPVARRRR